MWLDCSSIAGEIHKRAREYERTKWDLERKIQELEEKLNLQRQVNTRAHKPYYGYYLPKTFVAHLYESHVIILICTKT